MSVKDNDTADLVARLDEFGVQPTSLGARSAGATHRQQEILDRARHSGRVDGSQLASEFGVTTETIRRDLKFLEQASLLKRIHGGAIATGRLTAPPLPKRAVTAVVEKDAIAHAALRLLPTEGAILIDGGTTTLRLAELLPPSRLTVVTNAPAIGEQLIYKSGISVHMTGGRLRQESHGAVGTWALATLSTLRVDVAFIGTNGVSVDQGLSTPDADEAAVKQAMVKAARASVILADHTKLHTEYFSRFASLAEVQYLVTDWRASADALAPFGRFSLEVVVAPPAPSRTPDGGGHSITARSSAPRTNTPEA